MNEAMRLDVYVVSQLPDRPRTHARRLIDAGKVLVNGTAVTKASYHIKSTDKIKINDSDEKLEIPKIDIPIIYEDDDCVVIDKPLGMLSHSKGAYNPEATVATWLADKYGSKGGSRDGIVHRLDRATSGVMICAKTDTALSWLQKQFSTRKVKKTYIAVIQGTLKPEQAIIDMPIERNPKHPQKFRVGQNGKASTTQYETIAQFDVGKRRFSLVELKPTTGRTHQLRVHLDHQGHPIVGDTFYDGLKAERLYLHAKELELTLPSKERKIFSSPLPADFMEPRL